eukprot:2886019-Prymnesium_polylepis.1
MWRMRRGLLAAGLEAAAPVGSRFARGVQARGCGRGGCARRAHRMGPTPFRPFARLDQHAPG